MDRLSGKTSWWTSRNDHGKALRWFLQRERSRTTSRKDLKQWPPWRDFKENLYTNNWRSDLQQRPRGKPETKEPKKQFWERPTAKMLWKDLKKPWGMFSTVRSWGCLRRKTWWRDLSERTWQMPDWEVKACGANLKQRLSRKCQGKTSWEKAQGSPWEMSSTNTWWRDMKRLVGKAWQKTSSKYFNERPQTESNERPDRETSWKDFQERPQSRPPGKTSNKDPMETSKGNTFRKKPQSLTLRNV